MTYEEFEDRLGSYWRAANARGDRLIKVFFATFGAAVLIVILLVTCVIPKSFAEAARTVLLIAFGILAIYVIATARKFHMANGVFCPNCGKSLIALGEILEDLEEEGIERPDTLECPKCHHFVIERNA